MQKWFFITALFCGLVFIPCNFKASAGFQEEHGAAVIESANEADAANNGALSHEVSSSHDEAVSHGEEGHEKFSPGDFIFDHIADAHEWHITEIKGRPVSLPLPVILYSKGKGLDIFMSGKFHHGHESYKGYVLLTEGDNKGKIVNEETGEFPLDLSITRNVVALLFSIILLFWIFIKAGQAYKRNPISAPKGIQSLIEPVILFLRDEVAIPSIGEKQYAKFMPFLLTIFFFILINNLLGLIPIFPGGANLTGNIAVTAVLALFTLVVTNVSGNKNYWKHIFNTPGVPVFLKLPIPLMPLIETIGIFTKPFALMVRLFANITAGHIIAMGVFSMVFIFAEMAPAIGYGISVISVLFDVFMIFVELLVAFIQAFIFTFLSSIYIGMAVEEHHHE